MALLMVGMMAKKRRADKEQRGDEGKEERGEWRKSW